MDSTSSHVSASTTRLIASVVIVIVLMITALWFIISQNETSAWDFRNNLWGPTHLLLQGRSPYRIDQLFTGSNSIWLPQVVGAFAPLGALPQAQATNFWLLLSLSSLFVITRLSTQRRMLPLPLLALLLLMIYIFPPVITHTVLGQYSILATLLVIIASIMQQRGKMLWVGVALALALAKPQLLVLPLLGMMQASWQMDKWRGVIRLLGFTALSALLMTIPLWLSYADWIDGFLYALRINQVWLHPSSYQASITLIGNIGGVVWVILTVIIIGVNVFIWRITPPRQAIIYSLALNTLVIPYVWSWDFVVWLPLVVFVCANVRHHGVRGVLLIGYSAVVVSAYWVRINTSGDDVLFWWMPWGLGAVILITLMLYQRVTHQQHLLLPAHMPSEET